MKILIAIAAALSLALSACSERSARPAAEPASPGEEPAGGRFVGRMWISSTPGAAHGTFMIFLPDHTMLMGSCVETYRLSPWGVAGTNIRWIEETIPIEATVSMPQDNQLRLQIAGQDREQSYVLASAPYVCPDMPR